MKARMKTGLSVINEINLTIKIHSDAKKRRSFLTMLFATGDLGRYAFACLNMSLQFRIVKCVQ